MESWRQGGDGLNDVQQSVPGIVAQYSNGGVEFVNGIRVRRQRVKSEVAGTCARREGNEGRIVRNQLTVSEPVDVKPVDSEVGGHGETAVGRWIYGMGMRRLLAFVIRS